MEQYVKGFKGFTPVKICGLSPLASFYSDFRGPSVQALPLPSRVSFSRARFFLYPLLPSACYAGYAFITLRAQPKPQCYPGYLITRVRTFYHS